MEYMSIEDKISGPEVHLLAKRHWEKTKKNVLEGMRNLIFKNDLKERSRWRFQEYTDATFISFRQES